MVTIVNKELVSNETFIFSPSAPNLSSIVDLMFFVFFEINNNNIEQKWMTKSIRSWWKRINQCFLSFNNILIEFNVEAFCYVVKFVVCRLKEKFVNERKRVKKTANQSIEKIKFSFKIFFGGQNFEFLCCCFFCCAFR